MDTALDIDLADDGPITVRCPVAGAQVEEAVRRAERWTLTCDSQYLAARTEQQPAIVFFSHHGTCQQ